MGGRLCSCLLVEVKFLAAQLFLPVVDKVLLQTLLTLFVVMVLVVGWQYKRLQRMSEGLFYIEKNIYLRSTVTSTLFGIAGGILGSLLLLLFGIDLSGMGIVYLFIVAILLMLFHPRFLCFAYAGGLLCLSNILFGVPHIAVPQLLGLVAVLHMVESVLILVSGHLDPIPVYVRRNDGPVVGGFNLQKFWPIPLVAVMSAAGVESSGITFSTPHWWPLMKTYTEMAPEAGYALLPVLAILGYGEVATTAAPRVKARYSARNLFVFSLVLLFLAVLASHYPALSILPAVFAPLGHELVLWIGLKTESLGEPIFVMPETGVMILDVLPGSLAAVAGLASGDVVVSVNGVVVSNRRELQHILQFTWGRLNLEVRRGQQTRYFSVQKRPREVLGIILVPESSADRYLSFAGDSRLARVVSLFRRPRV